MSLFFGAVFSCGFEVPDAGGDRFRHWRRHWGGPNLILAVAEPVCGRLARQSKRTRVLPLSCYAPNSFTGLLLRAES